MQSNFTVPRPQNINKISLKQEFTNNSVSDHNETSAGDQSFVKVPVKASEEPSGSNIGSKIMVSASLNDELYPES
jgi:hypothetical protein